MQTSALNDLNQEIKEINLPISDEILTPLLNKSEENDAPVIQYTWTQTLCHSFNRSFTYIKDSITQCSAITFLSNSVALPASLTNTFLAGLSPSGFSAKKFGEQPNVWWGSMPLWQQIYTVGVVVPSALWANQKQGAWALPKLPEIIKEFKKAAHAVYTGQEGAALQMSRLFFTILLGAGAALAQSEITAETFSTYQRFLQITAVASTAFCYAATRSVGLLGLQKVLANHFNADYQNRAAFFQALRRLTAEEKAILNQGIINLNTSFATEEGKEKIIHFLADNFLINQKIELRHASWLERSGGIANALLALIASSSAFVFSKKTELAITQIALSLMGKQDPNDFDGTTHNMITALGWLLGPISTIFYINCALHLKERILTGLQHQPAWTVFYGLNSIFASSGALTVARTMHHIIPGIPDKISSYLFFCGVIFANYFSQLQPSIDRQLNEELINTDTLVKCDNPLGLLLTYLEMHHSDTKHISIEQQKKLSNVMTPWHFFKKAETEATKPLLADNSNEEKNESRYRHSFP